jgi:hypothetical protein
MSSEENGKKRAKRVVQWWPRFSIIRTESYYSAFLRQYFGPKLVLLRAVIPKDRTTNSTQLFIVRAFFHFHSIIQTTFSGQSGIIQK